VYKNVALTRLSGLVKTEMDYMDMPSWYSTKPPSQLILATVPWVGVMSNDDGLRSPLAREETASSA